MKHVGLGLVAVLLAAASADAGTLSIVDVHAPAVNCVFHLLCKVSVVDTVSDLPLPGLVGQARLQSRTLTGAVGTLGAGRTIYLYRVDLGQASGSVDCLAGLVVNFGPVTKLPYAHGADAEVFVITSGGLGTIGLKSAEQDGDVITFEFKELVCAGSAPGQGASTLFFGLAASTSPMMVGSSVFGVGSPPIVPVSARVPIHRIR